MEIGAVFQQRRETAARVDLDIFDVELGQVKLALDRARRLLAQSHRQPGRLAFHRIIGERRRVAAIANADRAAFGNVVQHVRHNRRGRYGNHAGGNHGRDK